MQAMRTGQVDPFLNRMNSQALTAEDLQQVLQEADVDLERAIRSADGRGILVALAEAIKKVSTSLDGGLALHHRLQGVSAVLRDSQGWELPMDDGISLVRKELLSIAADQPLIRDGEQITFDRKSFLDRALREIASDGNA